MRMPLGHGHRSRRRWLISEGLEVGNSFASMLKINVIGIGTVWLEEKFIIPENGHNLDKML